MVYVLQVRRQLLSRNKIEKNCPKHVEFHSKIKFEKIGAASWFYYKDLLTYSASCHPGIAKLLETFKYDIPVVLRKRLTMRMGQSTTKFGEKPLLEGRHVSAPLLSHHQAS
jgi:hypothetical protein